MEIDVNKNNSVGNCLQPSKLNFLLALVLALCGMLAGYFTTVYQIKLELVGKAENAALISLEKRVLSLEIYLKESMLTRQDLLRFQAELEKRIAAGEDYEH